MCPRPRAPTRHSENVFHDGCELLPGGPGLPAPTRTEGREALGPEPWLLPSATSLEQCSQRTQATGSASFLCPPEKSKRPSVLLPLRSVCSPRLPVLVWVFNLGG